MIYRAIASNDNWETHEVIYEDDSVTVLDHLAAAYAKVKHDAEVRIVDSSGQPVDRPVHAGRGYSFPREQCLVRVHADDKRIIQAHARALNEAREGLTA